MAGNPTTFKQKPRIKNGNTAQTDLKLADYMPVQHEDINSGVMTINHISVAQSLCQPVATTPNSTPSGGAYTATCSNYPDFSLTYLDKDGNSRYLIGMKVRVIFTTGITYGSVSGGTYPTLNINGSGAIPLLAQGKTMASGACSAGQSLEFTLIPYGNGVAWDADSNVRESTSDYTIYTDGNKKLTEASFPIKMAEKIYITRFFQSGSEKTVDLHSLGLINYDSILVAINGQYGFGGAAVALCNIEDGSIKIKEWVKRTNTWSDFTLTENRYLKVKNTSGGNLNTVSVLVIKLG